MTLLECRRAPLLFSLSLRTMVVKCETLYQNQPKSLIVAHEGESNNDVTCENRSIIVEMRRITT